MNNGSHSGLFDAQDEGQTPLGPDERLGLIPAWIATRDDLNAAEDANIQEGLAWGMKAVAKRVCLDDEFLKALHKKMFRRVWNWAGKFRTTERNIGIAPHEIPAEIRKLFDDLKAWEEFESYPIDERAARLHHRLTFIHPFPNGNGRCSRVITDLYLEMRAVAQFSWGVQAHPIGWRQAYVSALRKADEHDHEPLFSFVRS